MATQTEITTSIPETYWIQLINAARPEDREHIRVGFQNIYRRPMIGREVLQALERPESTQGLSRKAKDELRKRVEEARAILSGRMYEGKGTNTVGIRQVRNFVQAFGTDVLGTLRRLEPANYYDIRRVRAARKIQGLSNLPEDEGLMADCQLCGHKSLEDTVAITFEEKRNGVHSPRRITATPTCIDSLYGFWDVQEFQIRREKVATIAREAKKKDAEYVVVESLDALKGLSAEENRNELDRATKEQLTREYRDKLLERLAHLDHALRTDGRAALVQRELRGSGYLGALEPFIDKMEPGIARIYEAACRHDRLTKWEQAALADFYFSTVPQPVAALSEALRDIDALAETGVLEANAPSYTDVKPLLKLEAMTAYQMLDVLRAVPDLEMKRSEINERLAKSYDVQVGEVLRETFEAHEKAKSNGHKMHERDTRVVGNWYNALLAGKGNATDSIDKKIAIAVSNITSGMSFKRFEEEFPQLVLVWRKLKTGAYAELDKRCINTEDYRRENGRSAFDDIKAVRSSLVADPHYNTFATKTLKGIEDLAAKGVMDAETAEKLAAYADIAATCQPINGDQDIAYLRERINMGRIVGIDGLSGWERVLEAQRADQKALAKLKLAAKTFRAFEKKSDRSHLTRFEYTAEQVEMVRSFDGKTVITAGMMKNAYTAPVDFKNAIKGTGNVRYLSPSYVRYLAGRVEGAVPVESVRDEIENVIARWKSAKAMTPQVIYNVKEGLEQGAAYIQQKVVDFVRATVKGLG